MCEVTRNNFEELYPTIERNVQRADFIALDTEFTGLTISKYDRPSLFDTGEERYKRLRKSVTQFSMPQIGISAFVPDPNIPSKYYAHTYNFYLFPLSFGPIDVRFLCQASCFEFLCKHKFDFNKFAYEGVGYINDEQEAIIKTHLNKQDHIKRLDRLVDEWGLQELCSKVAIWCVQAADGDALALDISRDVPDIVLITELRERFKSIWSYEKDGQVVVEKVSLEKRVQLDLESVQDEEERILDRMQGFTKVFKAIVRCRKPLVGHNCFTDLMLIYDKFYKPLPEKYTTFKQDICDMFPKIVDTKHMSLTLRQPLEETDLLQHSGLGQLYASLSSEKSRFYVLYSPSISHGEGASRYEDEHCPHEAGYDAYMCGYIFLKMTHLYAVAGIKSSEVQPLIFIDYMNVVRPFINCINLIRARVTHVKLDDVDPASVRPQMLFVHSHQFREALSSEELARDFSAYGSVDIRLQGNRRALVAVSNHRCFRDILKAFHKHPSLCVVRYNPWKHTPYIRGALWCGVVVFGSISVWTLFSSIKTPSEPS